MIHQVFQLACQHLLSLGKQRVFFFCHMLRTSGVPHSSQNWAPASFSNPQLAQRIGPLLLLRVLQYKETARASPPLLLPEDTDGNVPGFGCDEANLFLVVVNHEIVVDDRAVGSGTHERAGAVCIHGIGVRTEYSLRDLAV